MITGSVQISKGYYYIVLNIYNEFGKRKPKWISTGLKVEKNKRKNETNKKKADKIKEDTLLKANMESNGSNRISKSLQYSKRRGETDAACRIRKSVYDMSNLPECIFVHMVIQ